MLRTVVEEAVRLSLKGHPFTLITPSDPQFGDFAIHFAHLQESGFTEPLDTTLNSLKESKVFEMVQVKGKFINLFISNALLTEELTLINSQSDAYGSSDYLKAVHYIVEFAHPNTHKLFHIGHVRNITTGECLSRLFAFSGARVTRANYQGDVGLHIAKCLYAVEKHLSDVKNLKSLEEQIAFLGKCYSEGTNAYETDTHAKGAIHLLNKQIYANDAKIAPLLAETKKWSLTYYDKIYERFHTSFDRLFFESETVDRGLEIARKALADGVLEKSEGAIIFRGEPHGVDTRVFINSLGLPTYETKELGLAEKEFSEFGEIDQCIHVVGNDHVSYFKTVFKVLEILNPKKYTNRQLHHSYGFVNLKSEKMSSRVGNIIEGNWLLDEVKKHIVNTFNVDDVKGEVLALAAVKYGFLKIDSVKNIAFDISESISLSGNSGPYLLYVYARANSVLKKADLEISSLELNTLTDTYSQSLLRNLVRFPEVVRAATDKRAPHLLCTYLYKVAQQFNLFYETTPILKAQTAQKNDRLQLTKAVTQIIKNGTHLLGFDVLESL